MIQSPLLSSGELMDQILEALNQKKPLSVVSVGATETFVMAQYTVLTEEEFMNDPEAKIANRGVTEGFLHRGVRFPNIQIRDDAVDAVRKADIVGYNTLIMWPHVGALTERVFKAYDIQPNYVYDSYLRRVIMFSQKKKFEQMLQNRKILLIGSLAARAKEVLDQNQKDHLGFEIIDTVRIDEYEELPEAKHRIDKCDFDLCLLAAGTNSLILSSYISTMHGKVAVDLGSGISSFITGEVYTDTWLENIISLEKLMSM